MTTIRKRSHRRTRKSQMFLLDQRLIATMPRIFSGLNKDIEIPGQAEFMEGIAKALANVTDDQGESV